MRAKEFTINIPINIAFNADGEAEIRTGDQPVDDETGDFIPPLQQKIELMKKTAGVKSAFDEEDGDIEDDDLSIFSDDDFLDG